MGLMLGPVGVAVAQNSRSVCSEQSVDVPVVAAQVLRGHNLCCWRGTLGML